MKLLLLLLLVGLFSSVHSCRTVFKSDVTLTGVCPNDTFIVPIGTERTYHCSYNPNGNQFFVFWNISGNIVTSTSDFMPPVVSVAADNTDSTATILAVANEVLDIQFNINFFLNPEKSIGTESVQLVTFGIMTQYLFDVCNLFIRYTSFTISPVNRK